jgi:AraC-like DNA-binding protein
MQELHEFRDALKTFEGDSVSWRRALESIAAVIPFSQVLVISTLPRGGTQILQPANVSDVLARAYAREAYAWDRATWQAIVQDKVVEGRHLWTAREGESGQYFRKVMQGQHWKYVAAAPLKAPVLLGYPGALHLYRQAELGEFTAAQLKLLAEVAQALDAANEKFRTPRRTSTSSGEGRPEGEAPAVWERPRLHRQFIFDSAGRQQVLVHTSSSGVLDDTLRAAIRQELQQRLAHLGGSGVEPVPQRIELMDQHGELWAFRVVAYRQFPALGDGAYVFFCSQPDSREWSALRPVDFGAAPEIARLIPTLRFMQQEYGRMPTLDEISAKARLSPFHFHRRFSELLGQTPKHFLLNCQIHHAKAALVERKKPLAQIAADCGFAHQSHFTSRFKQATGLTPTRWRRLAGEMAKSGATR